MRYAAVTQETVGREYFQALDHLAQRYQLPLHALPSGDLDPLRMLSGLTTWIHRHVAHEQGHPRSARLLIKRLKRIEAELQPLLRTYGQP